MKKNSLKILVIMVLLAFSSTTVFADKDKKTDKKPEKAVESPENIAITGWKLQKKQLNGKPYLKGMIMLKNTCKKELESVKISFEAQNSQAVTIKTTEWIDIDDVIRPGKQEKKTFRIRDVGDFGTLVMYVRYFYAAEGSGEDKTVKLKNIKKSLSGEFDSNSQQSLDEMFFTLSMEKPVRYSEEAYSKTVAEYNGKMGIVTDEKEEITETTSANTIILSNIDIDQPDVSKNEKNLIISLHNSGKKIAPGHLQLIITFKDANGKVLNEVEHICRKGVPQGKSTITIPKQVLKDNIQSWEYIYKFF